MFSLRKRGVFAVSLRVTSTPKVVRKKSIEKRALQVSVTNPVQCSLHGRKCTVSVETKINQSQPDFTKHRSGFVLCVPGN
ncbi:hypothetical protein Q9233_016200 [Columba guinea]|nr:hypothetical protein Q9233_016200 [Columba guinea]